MKRNKMELVAAIWLVGVVMAAQLVSGYNNHQPLSRINLHRAIVQLDASVFLHAISTEKGELAREVTVTFHNPNAPANTDWIAVFSPAISNTTTCSVEDQPFESHYPKLCTAPIKYKYANYSSPDYVTDGKGRVTFRLINQRADFSFGFFTGGIENPALVAMSNKITFRNPKAPAYPRLALGKSWNEMTVTWTSGYGLDEATPFVAWGVCGSKDFQFSREAYAETLTFTRNDMCGAPADTVGWRDPGYIHTSRLKGLAPSTKYCYKIFHRVNGRLLIPGDGSYFMSPPAPGQNSLQRLIFFGDMGKAEVDGSSEYSSQAGALNTTKQLEIDLPNFDMVVDIGDISYADGYLAQWDHFTEQITNVARVVPWMIASGNHERDWPNSGSFYNGEDSQGECGVPGQVMFNMPAKNRAKPWYMVDYGMFRLCFADTEQDWRKGTEQYRFLEDCFSSVNRQMQPWLFFIGHRVLGYSSSLIYGQQYGGGLRGEPNGRGSLQELWQKHKVDLAIFGHSHNYERTCPVFNNTCESSETEQYWGKFNATIHIVVGGGGGVLFPFDKSQQSWSIKKDVDYGFAKVTAYNHSSLVFEYKKSSTGEVYDSFWITRHYKDVLGCDAASHYCPDINTVPAPSAAAHGPTAMPRARAPAPSYFIAH